MLNTSLKHWEQCCVGLRGGHQHHRRGQPLLGPISGEGVFLGPISGEGVFRVSSNRFEQIGTDGLVVMEKARSPVRSPAIRLAGRSAATP